MPLPTPMFGEATMSSTTRADATASLPEAITTNYGSVVSFNSGTNSNYFNFDPSDIWLHDLPSLTLRRESGADRLNKNIKKAQTLFKAKKWREAIVCANELIHSPDAVQTSPEIVLVKYNLAHAYWALGELPEAIELFQYVAETREGNEEQFSQDISDSRYWFARASFHQKQYEEASLSLKAHVQAHDGKEQSTVESASTGRLWLGLTFEKLGRHEDAKEEIQRAYDTQNRTRGSQDWRTLENRHHLANFLYKREEFEEACKHYQALLKAEEQLMGPEPAQTVSTRCMLALSLAKLERFDDAKPHLERVVTRMENLRQTPAIDRDLGLASFWLGHIVLSAKPTRAEFYNAKKRTSTALDLLGRSDHSKQEVLECELRLAQAMLLEGNLSGAEQTFNEIRSSKGVPEATRIAAYQGLGRSLNRQSKSEKAKLVMQELVVPEGPLVDCRHSGEDYAACLHELSVANTELHQWAEARNCLERVVDAVPEIFSLAYCRSRMVFGRCCFEMQDFRQARNVFRQIARTARSLRAPFRTYQ